MMMNKTKETEIDSESLLVIRSYMVVFLLLEKGRMECANWYT